MSMPSFPESGLQITQEQAYNMIIASIAMEELGLSHIINAEGEKLQYVLGTLPGQHGSCASTQEILEVNKSITGLLESVMQNQLLLKVKLDKILGAKEAAVPRPPRPCDCAPCPKSNMQLVCASNHFIWKSGCPFPWECRSQSGGNIQWQECEPSVIRLRSQYQYWVSYSFSLRVLSRKSEAGSISFYYLLNDACFKIQSSHFCTGMMAYHPITISNSILLPACLGTDACLPISFSLGCSDNLCVEQASLSVIEL